MVVPGSDYPQEDWIDRLPAPLRPVVAVLCIVVLLIGGVVCWVEEKLAERRYR